jgi:hypothetical protein
VSPHPVGLSQLLIFSAGEFYSPALALRRITVESTKNIPHAYNEFIDLLSAHVPPDEILHFKPSADTLERVQVFLQKNREGSLSEDEEAELDHYEHLEHLIGLLKARALEQTR